MFKIYFLFSQTGFLYHVVTKTVLEAAESTNMANFGGWEAHTKGIGSKLMMKMGYEYGKGEWKCAVCYCIIARVHIFEAVSLNGFV